MEAIRWVWIWAIENGYREVTKHTPDEFIAWRVLDDGESRDGVRAWRVEGRNEGDPAMYGAVLRWESHEERSERAYGPTMVAALALL